MQNSRTRSKHIFTILAIAAFMVGVATPASLLVWQATSPFVALREGSAGTLVSTVVDRSFLPDNTLTRINTSTGTAVVHGVFSGLRGSPLRVVQFNKLTRLRLCIVGAHTTCAPLAGVWAGPLTPTAAAQTAVNFQRYGMTTRNLANCIGLGMLAVLIVALIGVIAHLGCEDADACTGSEAAP